MKKKVKQAHYKLRPVIRISGEQIDFVDLVLSVMGLLIDIAILIAIFVVSK